MGFRGVNHDLRVVDGRTLYMPPYYEGQVGWGNLTIPNIFDDDKTQLYPEGTRYVYGDRAFRYCKADSALYACMGCHDYGKPLALTLAAGTQEAGETTITVPDTDSSHTANYWAGGYLSIEAVSGWSAYMGFITASTASDSSTVDVTVDHDLPFDVATNNCTLATSPWQHTIRGLSISAIAAKRMSIVAVPLMPVTTAYWFWGQTWGPFPGMPQQFMGENEFERSVIFFDTDGAVGPRGNLGTKYQDAGFLIGNNTDAYTRNAIVFLTLSP